MINNPLRTSNFRISILIPMKGRGFIDQGSGLLDGFKFGGV